MNGSLTPSSGSASALSSLLASYSSKNDGRATSPPASSSSFAPPPPPDSSSSPHQPPMAHAPLTLHAISTLYHSTPPIDASVLRPILQVLYEDEQDWQLQPPHRALMLSDGVHSMRAIFDGQAARGVGAVRDNAVVQLEDYSVQGFPSSSVTVRGLVLVNGPSSALATATTPLRRIGQPARINPAPLPPSAMTLARSLQPLLLTSTGATTSTFYSSGSSSEDEIDSVVPTSPSSPTHQHASWKPRLPLELQAMIIKHCLASYRNDDKLERDRQKMNLREAASSAAGPPVVDAQAKKERLTQAMNSLEERSKCGTQEKNMGRWNLVLVCKNWQELSLPDLYRYIVLSNMSAYQLLATQLSSPRGKTLRKWIKRVVLRDVPGSWINSTSSVGTVLSNLGPLESLKVRFMDPFEGRHAGVTRRVAAVEGEEEEEGSEGSDHGEEDEDEEQELLWKTDPSIWEMYPNLNPRIFHQHHLHTFGLPGMVKQWPRSRVTSSEFVYCLTHPVSCSHFPELPLKSHHLTIFIAGDTARAAEFPRFLARLVLATSLQDFRATIRCASASVANAVERVVWDHDAIQARLGVKKAFVVEVAWQEKGQKALTTRKVGTGVRHGTAEGEESSQEQQAGAQEIAA